MDGWIGGRSGVEREQGNNRRAAQLFEVKNVAILTTSIFHNRIHLVEDKKIGIDTTVTALIWLFPVMVLTLALVLVVRMEPCQFIVCGRTACCSLVHTVEAQSLCCPQPRHTIR
jgi:hypothetical protein